MRQLKKIKTLGYVAACATAFVGNPMQTKASSAEKATKPNMIILIADDISRDDMGCYGHPVIKTPNIDQLANNGVKFTNAFLTASSCSPSRTSIILGRYPHNTGACELHSPIPKNQIPFPKLLKEAGYYTGQSGKWHFGASAGKPTGVALEAFDRVGGGASDGGGKSGAEMWVPYLKERPADKPFFMWFAAHDAHRGWDNEIFLPEYKAKDVIVPPYMVDDEQTREDLVCYYNEVSRFDFYIGEVVKELKKQGVYDNTILIVMADNGRPFPRDKTRLYDSGIKTPFVIHWPKGVAKKGATSESLVSVIDIAPTLLGVAGIEAGDSFQGRSFVKLLEAPETKFRSEVYAEHNWHDYEAFERMVRTKDFLYVENGRPNLNQMGAQDIMTGGAGKSLRKGNKAGTLNEVQGRIFKEVQPEVELYNCAEDSLQLTNVANNAKYKQVQKQLQKQLHRWMKKTKDSKPEHLTGDWYSREDCKPLKTKGIRGDMPGFDQKATEVKSE
ncbi:heparan N-sulfatase [Puteibacter caeruleilacunae]|nr:heparan N-sulfatase [Puteibacter caeruleilacunae]